MTRMARLVDRCRDGSATGVADHRHQSCASYCNGVFNASNHLAADDVAGDPDAEDVARVLALARILMPSVPVSLGCARPRDAYSERLEELAVDAGVNRMALWSRRAIDRAHHYDLDIEFTKTCCSFPDRLGGVR